MNQMFKKVSKSLISVVLVLCITVSVFSVSLFSVSAGFLTDKLYDKLYDIGMRVACEVTETFGGLYKLLKTFLLLEKNVLFILKREDTVVPAVSALLKIIRFFLVITV